MKIFGLTEKEKGEGAKVCSKCGKRYDESWEVCLACSGKLVKIDDEVKKE
ncbi:MAG: hypothetical protein HQL29_01940 [Candidatus Omnitrophica bacterium]|nr:hypothetical protein [Candidatus Omnitrophota bacterium]